MVIAALLAVVVSFLQSPGRVAADTKLDLTADPIGFLGRAAHQWTPNAPMGQVQNQAYGYFFPHGSFFALGEVLHLPPWVIQRLWWAVLLVVGFVGIVRLAEAMRIGSPGSRVIAAIIFVLSPRVLTTIGSISSETLPMVLAPWVLIPLVRVLDRDRAARTPRADDTTPHRPNTLEPDPSHPNTAGPAPATTATDPLWRPAAQSAAAVALMGAVNAVATVAAVGVAVVWWLLHAPALTGRPAARWWRFGAWWALGLAMACAWWLIPLLILSRVSPPFLDFIESSRVTTEWTSLTEVLRGTSSWTPFVSPERVAGAVLVTQPAAVLATGVLAAAGLAGLCMRHMPSRGRLVTVLTVGLLLMCVGFAGQLGSPIAEPVRVFLDGPGAALRNIHKFEPFIRIPLVLGVAHLLARVPLPGTVSVRETLAGFANPQRSRPVAATIVVVVAAIGAGSLLWTGQLAPAGTYTKIPDYWPATAKWLADHGSAVPASGTSASGTSTPNTTTPNTTAPNTSTPSTPTAHRPPPDSPAQNRPAQHPPPQSGPGQHSTAATRSLVVPGAPFADQLWGLTRDEPMQPLADDPWAVRDAIPLTPPGAIRALDSVQRDIANGRGSPGLAATLAQQGIGFVVLRADLDPDSSRSARPLVARQALETSPGLTEVASFGPDVSPPSAPGVVRDNGLRPPLPAISIYAVRGGVGFPGTGPVLVDADSTPRVAGGPEALAAVQEDRARRGLPPMGPSVLDADARAAGVGAGRGGVTITDSPADRETDFGRVDDHSSAIRASGDPRRTQNAAPDYPVTGQPLVRGEWLLDNQPGQVRVSASGSASDATQLGQTSPSNSTAAAFDGDPDTAWVSSGLDSAVGQWLRLDFTRPRTDLAVTVTTAKAIGPDVTGILVTTEAGSSVAQGVEPGEPVTVTAPSGPTRWVQLRAISTANGLAGNQFAIGEVSLTDLSSRLPIAVRHRVTLPAPPAGTSVAGWLLTQELGGRSACVDDGPAVRCAPGLGLTPETPRIFTRTLSVPGPVAVAPSVVLRPRSGDGLRALISAPGQITADGPTGVDDPRGNASAAVDGDVGTTWTAPEGDSGSSAADRRRSEKPELTIRLPERQRVERLRLVLPQRYPASPTRVGVDLGTGTQVRDVGRDGVVELDPAVTDRIGITITKTTDLIDVNSLGFARPAPAGISEVRIEPAPTATTAARGPDRPVEIGCDAGLGITVSGQVIGLSVRTTARALRDGQPVVARPCSPAPVPVGGGEQELSVNPGTAFTVDQVSLPVVDAPEASTADPTVPAIGDWSATHRTVEVARADGDRFLVVPESTNSGWQAELGGTMLRPVVMNGWQQGWVVPAGADGTLTLTYRFDSVYRWSLGIGLALMAVVLAAAWWPRRRREAAVGTRAAQQEPDPTAPDPTAPDPTEPDPTATASTASASASTTTTATSMATATAPPAEPTADIRNRAPSPVAPSPATPFWLAATAVVGWTVASWLLSGWWGLAVSTVVGAAAWWLTARRPGVGVVVVFAAMTLATVGLAAGPWHASTGYHGFDWWVQLPALVAVSLTVWLVAVERLRSSLVRSRVRNQRRAGSSMNA